MRISILALALAMAAAAADAVAAQNPPPATIPPVTAGVGVTAPAVGQRGGRRPPIQEMTLSTAAWADGAQIPAKHTQMGAEVSPPLSWSVAPTGTASFVLIMHDLNAPTANGLDDLLHWLVWNIPATATGLPEGLPQGPELPDGTRQISVTGPNYRGPALSATAPQHHYVFELFALDTVLDVKPVGASPAATRAAILEAMAGHVRGKAVLIGRYKRPE